MRNVRGSLFIFIIMNMIVQCGVLFIFLALGELIVWLSGITVPSSIIGMLLLTFALKLGAVKPAHVEKMADFLVHNLGFFFVPAGVGLISCLDLLAAEWLPITGAAVASTAVIMVVTGHVHQSVRRYMRNMSRRHASMSNTQTPD